MDSYAKLNSAKVEKSANRELTAGGRELLDKKLEFETFFTL
jgi:hypothetical protein